MDCATTRSRDAIMSRKRSLVGAEREVHQQLDALLLRLQALEAASRGLFSSPRTLGKWTPKPKESIWPILRGPLRPSGWLLSSSRPNRNNPLDADWSVPLRSASCRGNTARSLFHRDPRKICFNFKDIGYRKCVSPFFGAKHFSPQCPSQNDPRLNVVLTPPHLAGG